MFFKKTQGKTRDIAGGESIVADFCHLNLLCGVQQPRDETVEAGRYQLSTM